MKIEGGNHAGDLLPPDEPVGELGDSSLDRLAVWSIETEDFVGQLGKTYRRWSTRPPNSPRQRRAFEKQLKNLVDDAKSLEGDLRVIGNGLPDGSRGRALDDSDHTAVKVFEQLFKSRFLDAWRLMSRRLEEQVANIQEPKTAAEWRGFFRRFDKVWKSAQDLGKAASAARLMLDELQLDPGLHSAGTAELWQDDRRMSLQEISSICGELVEFLVEEEVLRDDGRPPISSKDVVESRGLRGRSGAERLNPLVEKLEGYIDLVDRLISELNDLSFLRARSCDTPVVEELRSRLCHMLECAQSRHKIANNVLAAALEVADPFFVPPGEALRDAQDAKNALQDLALQERQFGKAIERAAKAVTSQLKVPRAWNDLDALERAIINHLHLRPDSKRKEVTCPP